MLEVPYEVKMFGETFEVVLSEARYAFDNSLAIVLNEVNGEPFTKLSVNLEESETLPVDVFFAKHWGENEGLIDQLIAKGIIALVPEIETVSSGFIDNIKAYRIIR